MTGALFPAPCAVPESTPDGEVAYEPCFLDPPEADALFAALQSLPDWHQEELEIFGRKVHTPRLVAWYGDPGVRYRYSGVDHEALPWPSSLAALRERLRASLGVAFNGVLANRYRDGRDSMGWHSDDERELGPRPVIAAVSLGAQRRFLMRHRTRKELATLDLPLEHGSLLVMRGETQRHWRHAIPKTARPVGERVSLTFRLVRDSAAR